MHLLCTLLKNNSQNTLGSTTLKVVEDLSASSPPQPFGGSVARVTARLSRRCPLIEPFGVFRVLAKAGARGPPQFCWNKKNSDRHGLKFWLPTFSSRSENCSEDWFSHGLDWLRFCVQFWELLQEHPRIPRVAPRMALSLRERVLEVEVVPRLLDQLSNWATDSPLTCQVAPIESVGSIHHVMRSFLGREMPEKCQKLSHYMRS